MLHLVSVGKIQYALAFNIADKICAEVTYFSKILHSAVWKSYGELYAAAGYSNNFELYENAIFSY